MNINRIEIIQFFFVDMVIITYSLETILKLTRRY